jgi:hypothetical protein
MLLIGCASEPRVITRTEKVEVKVEVTKPLPEQLTAPLPYPEPLGETFTIGDIIESLIGSYDTIDQCNRDRATAKRITDDASQE